MQSRSWVPLDIPISTAAGHIRSPEFEINLEGEYWIYVDVDRQFKPDSIECLLGLPPYYNDCHDHPSIVQTSWRITKAGNEVARDHNIAPVGSVHGIVWDVRLDRLPRTNPNTTPSISTFWQTRAN